MKRILLILLSLIIAFFSCSKEPESTSTVKSKIKSGTLINASNSFGLHLFQQIDSLMPDDNFFISPFSALQALSMAYNGAAENTQLQMAKVLGFEKYNSEEINGYNQSLTRALIEADKNVTFEVANSIWYDQLFEVLPSFIDINVNYFDASINKVDFREPNTVNLINDWCKEKTHGKIPTIIDRIPDNAVMYLINAIYFLGTWQYAFDESKTTEAKFYLENGENVDYMQIAMEANLRYYSDSQLSAVELPYGNGSFAMIFILPVNGINSFIETLTPESWGQIQQKMVIGKTVVKIPKFKFEFKSLLNKPLYNLGMVDAFDCDRADFSNINPVSDLCISRVIHKTYIELNEKGTEAAAVTAIEIIKTTANPDEPHEKINYFIADRPFMYAIIEKSTGGIIFIGKMMNPNQEKTELE